MIIMKIYIKILLSSVFIISTFSASILAANYPLNKGEQRRESMGSVTEADGLIFRPQRVQNNETKNNIACNVNQYLWQAALDVMKSAPLASIDSNSGVIITDWYSPKNKQNYNFKINIFIKADRIAPEALEVRVFEQKLQHGKWIAVADSSNLSNILEEKILQHARSLYIKEKK
jgi:Domain of unknown function (DUF3576)